MSLIAALTGILMVAGVAAVQEARVILGHENSVIGVAFSPDAQRLVSSGSDRSVRVWDVTTGIELRAIRGFKGAVDAAVFSPDGRWIAVADTWGYAVRLHEATTGREVRVFRGHTYFVRAVAYSPDGRTVASAGDDDTVRLWDVTTGRQIRLFKGHTDNAVAVTYSRDGRYLLSAGEQDDKTLRLWDVASGRQIRVFKGHVGSPRSMALSRDGRVAVSGGADGTVRTWNVETGQQTRVLMHIHVSGVAYSPDGRYIASAGALARSASGPDLRSIPGWRSGFSNGIILWDASTGQAARVLIGHTDTIYAVAFSADGKLLVTGSGDKTIRVWPVD